jgi:NAD(P)H-dependent FMN reductase
MNILAFCGSLRRASMNAALLRAVARLAPAHMRVEIFDGLGRLPLFNPDLERPDLEKPDPDRPALEPGLPPPVRRLHAAIEGCDALLIASPEYAHGVTGVLKNALDWLVSFEGFVGKPVAIFNASPRSLHAAASLREILVTMSATLLADACLDLPLRGTGLGEPGIIDAHGAAIRGALDKLAGGVGST